MMRAESAGRGLQAPLFEQLIRSLDEDRRHVVMDCGAARSGTIALLSELRCRLDILDLAQCLPELGGLEDPGERRACLAECLPGSGREPVDLVFCWNLLNYLKPADIETVGKLLSPLLKPGARLHALIEYSSPLMPASPGHWVPDASARLFADQVDLDQIPSPRYSPKKLQSLMPQFQPEKTMLLGNGLQEHLFRMRL
ncbi:MAG: hypothetical protein EA419_02105 [Wenzhouxiangella sp.]|nr:MAG: hypothetical protein EA419_02105 [Wenzhouxiangella sp.]